jgi:chromosome partitioning protein
LLINALSAADSVIVPVQTQKFAQDAIGQLMDVISVVKENINPKLEIGGILLTMADNTNMSAQVEAEIRSRFGENVFGTVIRRRAEAGYSTQRKQSLVFTGGILGSQYEQMAAEFLGIGKGGEDNADENS